MGKVKQWAEDTGQLNEPFWYYEGMQELADIEHEHAVKNGNVSYRLTETEYETYNLYMEGKLCGEQQNIALTSTGINLNNGQIRVGRRRRQNTQK
jgi:hypothetical protein